MIYIHVSNERRKETYDRKECETIVDPALSAATLTEYEDKPEWWGTLCSKVKQGDLDRSFMPSKKAKPVEPVVEVAPQPVVPAPKKKGFFSK